MNWTPQNPWLPLAALVAAWSLATGATAADAPKPAAAAGLPPGLTPEMLTADQNLFLKVAVTAAKWNEPAPPRHVLGPIYFVGTQGLAVWLIKSSEGLILMNTAMPEATPMIVASIRKLGFDPKDIRLLLACHAHVDHVGGHAEIQTLSSARVAMLSEDVPQLESGGKTDFHYADYPAFAFAPLKVDQVLRDGETIKLGDVALTALLTPGHARGSTTWVMPVVVDGKAYSVVFPDGSGVNPGFRVARNESYPGIGNDYRHSLHVLETLKPDVWLASHTDSMAYAAKAARADTEGVAAWVDPEGYRRFVASQRALFEAAVAREMGVAPAAPK
jgi:metallo-beta-lactamase class B